MTDSKDLTPPTKSIRDTVHSLAKGGISFIPGGGLVAEIFNLFVVPSYQKRFERWMNTVAAKLDELRRLDLVKWEDLEGDERFVTVLIQCTQAAMRQHQKEKLDLLLNAVSNSAQKSRVEEDMESIFIRHIDELTVEHFVLLTFLFEREKDLSEIKSYEDLLKIFSINRGVQIGNEEFRLFCGDLDSRFLVRFSHLMKEFKGDPPRMAGYLEAPYFKVTNLGKNLLTFVKDHKKNDQEEG